MMNRRETVDPLVSSTPKPMMKLEKHVDAGYSSLAGELKTSP